MNVIAGAGLVGALGLSEKDSSNENTDHKTAKGAIAHR